MSESNKKHSSLKEDNVKDLTQVESTVLGTLQMICCLLISSLGAILFSAPHSPYFETAVSIILMSGFPFVGALWFGITGFLSIITGKKPSRTFILSSLILNALNVLVAAVGIFLFATTLKALKTASQQCNSGKNLLSSEPYASYNYSINKEKECLIIGSSLTSVMLVMLLFTILDLLLAAYSSLFWWKYNYSTDAEGTFSLP